MKDGPYGVYWYDNDAQPLGTFEVKNNRIVTIEGDWLKKILELGPVTGMNRFRATHGLNNGYYRVAPMEQVEVGPQKFS